MTFDAASFLLGAMLGSIAVVVLVFPRVGRVFAKSISVVFLIAGVGLLTWATTAMIRGSELTPIVWESISISQPSEVLGYGGGLLAGSILALVLSFVGKPDQESR